MQARALIHPIERQLVMRRGFAFQHLDTREIEILARYAREQVYRKGEVLQRDDQPPTAAHLIVEGTVEIMRDGVIVQRVTAPFGIGAFDYFANRDGGMRATALTDVVTLRFPMDVMLEVLEDEFPVLHLLIKGIAGQLIERVRELPEDRDVPDNQDRPLCRCAGHTMDLVERLVFLRRMSVFARSSLDAVTQIARGFEEVRFPAGVEVWREGDEATQVLCIVDGTLRASITGKSSVIRYHRYSVVGGLAGLAQVPRFQTIVTETPVVALAQDHDRLLDAIEDNFEMGLALLSAFASETLAIQRRLRELGVTAPFLIA